MTTHRTSDTSTEPRTIDGAALGAYRAAMRRRILSHVLRRIAIAFIALVSLVFVTFFVIRIIPGDPAQLMAGENASPEVVEAMRDDMGLNQPLLLQFAEYCSRLLSFDLGASLVSGEAISTIISERLPLTAALTAAGLAVAVSVGLTLGIVAAALTRNGAHPRFEAAFVYTTGGLGAVPEIALGTALVAVFATALNWTPVSGIQGNFALVLPALAIGLRPAFNLARVVRVELLHALGEQYMQTAASKRISLSRQFVVHAMPNTATPLLTLFGLLFSHVVGGVVVVETLFAWPGLGSALLEAVLTRDYPGVQALLALLGAMVIIVNLLIDQLIVLIDPRIALDGTGGNR